MNATVDTAAKMYRWLDREAVAKARTRRMRNRVRKLPPVLRKFALALRRVVEDVSGPENLQGEKIMKALKIGRSRYYELRLELEKTLV